MQYGIQTSSSYDSQLGIQLNRPVLFGKLSSPVQLTNYAKAQGSSYESFYIEIG